MCVREREWERERGWIISDWIEMTDSLNSVARYLEK